MNNSTRLMIAATIALSLAACTKKVKEVPADSTGGDSTGATTGGITDSTPGKYSPSDLDTDSCLRQRVVYFDFNDDTLKPDFQAAVACHAKYLRDRPEARMSMGLDPGTMPASRNSEPRSVGIISFSRSASLIV